MGSIVVSDVAHHFPYAMLGANARLPSTHEPSAPQPTYRSEPLRPSQPEPLNPSLCSAGLVDTPMADAVPRTAASASRAPPQQRSSLHAPAPYAASSVRGPQQLHPSPRFHGHPGQDACNPSLTRPRTIPSSTSSSVQNSPARSANLQPSPSARSPARIKVKSLSHIQSFVIDELNPLSQSRTSSLSHRDGYDSSPQYEISEMPVTDIIEMVAGLLAKITTTNDRQHEHLHRQIPPADGTAHLSQQTTSVLAFHGKNIPSISILSYLSRIHKYCPTTYEVFLSLLVYFDRMTERVNSAPMQSLRQASQQALERHGGTSDGSRHSSVSSTTLLHESPNVVTRLQAATPPPSGSLGKPSEPPASGHQEGPPSPPAPMDTPLSSDPYNLSHFFVVDSFNIHRLVIAGVTCASKFFSDIFYTNSRYAKVCGSSTPVSVIWFLSGAVLTCSSGWRAPSHRVESS